MSQKNIFKTYRLSNDKNSKNITKRLEAKLVEFAVDRTRYHGGDLEGTSIVRLFQMSLGDNFLYLPSFSPNKLL